MKKTFVVSVLVIMLAVSGSLYANARAFGGDCGGPDGVAEEAQGKRHGGKMAMLGKILDLSDEQEAQVKEIMQAEHDLSRPYMDQVRQGQEAIHALVTSGQFDEAKVRALAETQTVARTELMVAKTRAHSKIWSLLTAEQRALAEKIHPLFAEGGRHRGH